MKFKQSTIPIEEIIAGKIAFRYFAKCAFNIFVAKKAVAIVKNSTRNIAHAIPIIPCLESVITKITVIGSLNRLHLRPISGRPLALKSEKKAVSMGLPPEAIWFHKQLI